MLSITLIGQKCNNLIRDSQSYLTYQNNFKNEIGVEVSLVCYAESIFSSYESFYDVTNNFVHKFFNALSNTRSKYILLKKNLQYCINCCTISIYFIGYQNVKLKICSRFYVNILLFIGPLIPYICLYFLKCKVFCYYVGIFIFYETLFDHLDLISFYQFFDFFPIYKSQDVYCLKSNGVK